MGMGSHEGPAFGADLRENSFQSYAPHEHTVPNECTQFYLTFPKPFINNGFSAFLVWHCAC
jgi:hypothetical protein